MAKTQEELNKLKQEYEKLNAALNELTDDELKQIAGGKSIPNAKIDGPKYAVNTNVRCYCGDNGLEIDGIVRSSSWEDDYGQYIYVIWHDKVRFVRGWKVDYLLEGEENVLEENIKYSF